MFLQCNKKEYTSGFSIPEPSSFGMPLISESKQEKLFKVKSQVNDDYIEYKISEFLVSCYKASTIKLPKVLGIKVENVIIGSEVKKYSQLRSKSGQSLNLLGLADADIENAIGLTLSKFEHLTVKDMVQVVINKNIQQMEDKKSQIKDTFGGHCERAEQGETVSKSGQMAALYNHIQNQMKLVEHQLEANQLLMLETLVIDKSHTAASFEKVKHVSLRFKTKFLQLKISSQKLQLENHLYKSNLMLVTGMDFVGDHLNQSVEDTKHELEGLNKTLREYTEKEKDVIYKNIIAEFNTALRGLKFKKATLTVLNDSENTF